MTNEDLANKLAVRVDFMLLQHLPRPTCQSKQKAHAELIREIKRLIAEKLNPDNHGLNITITV